MLGTTSLSDYEPLQSYFCQYDTDLIANFYKIQANPLRNQSEAMWVRLVDWVFHCVQVSGIQDKNVFFTAIDLMKRFIASESLASQSEKHEL